MTIIGRLTVAGAVALTLVTSVRDDQDRLDPQVVSDLFTGLGGDLDALKRGIDGAEKQLAETPDDPEALAWRGAATRLRSVPVGYIGHAAAAARLGDPCGYHEPK